MWLLGSQCVIITLLFLTVNILLFYFLMNIWYLTNFWSWIESKLAVIFVFSQWLEIGELLWKYLPMISNLNYTKTLFGKRATKYYIGADNFL